MCVCVYICIYTFPISLRSRCDPPAPSSCGPHLSFYLSFYLSIWICIYIFRSIFTDLYICLPISLSLYIYIYIYKYSRSRSACAAGATRLHPAPVVHERPFECCPMCELGAICALLAGVYLQTLTNSPVN